MAVMLTFRYDWEQSCKGEWGISNPIPELKNGKGFCNLKFALYWKWSQNPLISWESYYDGDWRQGKKHGKGIFLSFSGLTYEGQWDNDRRHGQGKMTLKDGTVFNGNWIEDRFEGPQNSMKMILTRDKYPESWRFLNGSTYQGSVIDGIVEGIGTLTLGLDINSTSKSIVGQMRKIEGEWIQGIFQDGSIYLCGGVMITSIRHFSRWGINNYIADSLYEFKNEGNSVQYHWNGNSLIQIGEKENKTIALPQNTKLIHYSCDTRSSKVDLAELLPELYDTLLALKWFEFHGLLAQNGVRLEPFSFHKVDQDQEQGPSMDMAAPPVTQQHNRDRLPKKIDL